MELLSILFKINVSLLIFYLAYRWVLRRLTFYNFNRIYLLSGIMISALLPFLQGNVTVRTGISKMQQAVGMNPDDLFMSMKAYHFWDLETIALFVYWSGVCLMSLIFLIQLVSLLLLFLRSRKERLFGYSVRILQEQSQPFSFFRGIFINPSRHSREEMVSILQHEEIHVRQWHSVDVLLGEIKRILCWFNPAAWLMLSAIRENLEFIADRKVLQNGMDVKAYQYTLLSVQQSVSPQLITNNFNFSHLKLRITMMNKRKSSDLHLMKYLLAVPVIAMASMLTNYASAQQDKDASDATITINGTATFDLEELENLSDQELEQKLGIKKEDIKTVEIRKDAPGILGRPYEGDDHTDRVEDKSITVMVNPLDASLYEEKGLKILKMEARPGERMNGDQTAGFTAAGVKLYNGKRRY
ncbi:MAG: M56 family metallopeptidase [Taibaiella sp.]|nr:M56 family metallopeptidase [Taibaiella sp.]